MKNGENYHVHNTLYLTWLTRPAQYRKLSTLTEKHPGGSVGVVSTLPSQLFLRLTLKDGKVTGPAM